MTKQIYKALNRVFKKNGVKPGDMGISLAHDGKKIYGGIIVHRKG
jgi:hypothetical protein